MPYTICCDNQWYRGHDTDHTFKRAGDHTQAQVADEATARALVDAHAHLHCPDLDAMPDADPEDGGTDAGAWEEDTDLTDIDGIGDATADALHGAGITSVQALASVDDVAALAEQISGVSKSVLAGFQGRARAMMDAPQDATPDADA